MKNWLFLIFAGFILILGWPLSAKALVNNSDCLEASNWDFYQDANGEKYYLIHQEGAQNCETSTTPCSGPSCLPCLEASTSTGSFQPFYLSVTFKNKCIYTAQINGGGLAVRFAVPNTSNIADFNVIQINGGNPSDYSGVELQSGASTTINFQLTLSKEKMCSSGVTDSSGQRAIAKIGDINTNYIFYLNVQGEGTCPPNWYLRITKFNFFYLDKDGNEVTYHTNPDLINQYAHQSDVCGYTTSTGSWGYACPYDAPDPYPKSDFSVTTTLNMNNAYTSPCPHIFSTSNGSSTLVLPSHIVRDPSITDKKYGAKLTIKNINDFKISGEYEFWIADYPPAFTERFDLNAINQAINGTSKPIACVQINDSSSTVTTTVATSTFPSKDQYRIPFELEPGEEKEIKISPNDCPGYYIGRSSVVHFVPYYYNSADGKETSFNTDYSYPGSYFGSIVSTANFPYDGKIGFFNFGLDKSYYQPNETVKIYAGGYLTFMHYWFAQLILDGNYNPGLPKGSVIKFWVEGYNPNDGSTTSLGTFNFTLKDDLPMYSLFGTFPDVESMCPFNNAGAGTIRCSTSTDETKTKIYTKICLRGRTMPAPCAEDLCYPPYSSSSYPEVKKNRYLDLGTSSISFTLPDSPPDKIRLYGQVYIPNPNNTSQLIPLLYGVGWGRKLIGEQTLTPLLVVDIPKNTGGNCSSSLISLDSQYWYQVSCQNLKYNNKTPMEQKQYMTRFVFKDLVERAIASSSARLGTSTNQLVDNQGKFGVFYNLITDSAINVIPTTSASIEFLSTPHPNPSTNVTYTHQFTCDWDNDGYLAPYCCDSSLPGYDQVSELCAKGTDCNDADPRIHPDVDYKSTGEIGHYKVIYGPGENDSFELNCASTSDPRLNIAWDCDRVPTCVTATVEISNLETSYNLACEQSRIPTFSWHNQISNLEYTVDQYRYTVELCKDSNCNNVLYSESSQDLTVSPSTSSWDSAWRVSPECSGCCDRLSNKIEYGGQTYYGRVKVQAHIKELDGWTDVAISNTTYFTTQPRCWPRVDFTCNDKNCAEAKITAGQTVSLENKSEYELPYNCQWSFDPDNVKFAVKEIDKEGKPISYYSATDCTTQVKFNQKGAQEVTLTITDQADSHISCSGKKELNVKFSLPKYKEVPPLRSTSELLQKNFASLINAFKPLLLVGK